MNLFYVGKGKGRRWNTLTRANNKHFNNINKSIKMNKPYLKFKFYNKKYKIININYNMTILCQALEETLRKVKRLRHTS